MSPVNIVHSNKMNTLVSSEQWLILPLKELTTFDKIMTLFTVGFIANGIIGEFLHLGVGSLKYSKFATGTLHFGFIWRLQNISAGGSVGLPSRLAMVLCYSPSVIVYGWIWFNSGIFIFQSFDVQTDSLGFAQDPQHLALGICIIVHFAKRTLEVTVSPLFLKDLLSLVPLRP